MTEVSQRAETRLYPLSSPSSCLPSSLMELMFNHHEIHSPPFIHQKQFRSASTSHTPFCPSHASSRIIRFLGVLKRALSDGTYPCLHCPQPSPTTFSKGEVKNISGRRNRKRPWGKGKGRVRGRIEASGVSTGACTFHTKTMESWQDELIGTRCCLSSETRWCYLWNLRNMYLSAGLQSLGRGSSHCGWVG